RFLPMVDDLYERNNFLVESGFKVFQVEEKIIQFFCVDAGIVEQEREFTVLTSKNAVSQGVYKADYINNQFRKAWDKERETGEPWYAAPSPFWQQFMKSEFTNPVQHQKVMADFLKEKEIAWSEEIHCFCTNAFKFHYDNKISSWVKLFEEVSSLCAAEKGFERNKKISDRKQIVFLKSIGKKWSIYILFDLNNLKKPMHHDNIIKSIEVLFGLVYLENDKTKLNKASTSKSVLSFEYFFPINKVFMDYLKSFETLQEIEVLARVYFVLYGLISKEFERIALDSIKNQ
ncbi:hypothetical protein MNBD_GAMMA03-1260, partial [hydrothermal vent metagenome]